MFLMIEVKAWTKMTASADTPAALAVLDKLDGKQTPA